LDLTISIVNYNTKEFLHECLNSIYCSNIKRKFQICVVDNNSIDGSSEMVESCFRDVQLTTNCRNEGFAVAHNQIIKNTFTKYILVLNPDIIVLPESINKMFLFLEDNSAIGVLGCKLLNPDGSLQYSCRTFPDPLTILLRGLDIGLWFSEIIKFRNYMMADWDHSSIAEVDWITGSCMMLRRDALNDIGLFDESFFMYFEDVDLCLRMYKNWKVGYFPYSQMIHHHLQQSQKLTSIRQKLIHFKSAYRFFKKHRPYFKRPAIRRGADKYAQ